MTNISRRTLTKYGLGGLAVAGTSLNSTIAFSRNSRKENDDHFFIQLIVPMGMDPSYLFDARPLKMTTEDKIIQNYLMEDPSQWTGTNGQSTWATKLTAPLQEFKNDFTILNGVIMAATFDGHDQNTNFLLTANPFGGDFFAPFFNETKNRTQLPLDFIQSGFFGLANITNQTESVSIDPRSANGLSKMLKEVEGFNKSSPLYRFTQERMALASKGSGRFSQGSKAMMQGHIQGPDLVDKLSRLEIPQEDGGDSTNEDSEENTLKALRLNLTMITQLFKNGATRSALYGLGFINNIDSHDAESAKKQPETYGLIAKQFAEVLRFLKNTPFDATRSFFDVTTITFTSEFARTLRQANTDIMNTGTDHNALNNSVLIAGKGIKGGLVIGQSDTQSGSEVLSGAHKALDPDHLKAMARPFDFGTSRPRTDLPESYKASDYLSYSSVTNTLCQMFGVDKSLYRITERNGNVAETIKGLTT